MLVRKSPAHIYARGFFVVQSSRIDPYVKGYIMFDKFLEGKKIYLRPLEEFDHRLVAGWINDPEVTHFMFFGQVPRTMDQVRTFIASQIANENNVLFMIHEKKLKTAVGFCGLYDWHRTARKVEMRILIGDVAAWGKGIGTETVELITHYGFDRLNLNRIYLGFTAHNKTAGRVYKKVGYVREGILREDIYRNGRYYDSVRMGILRSEYEKKLVVRLRKRFASPRPTFLKGKSP